MNSYPLEPVDTQTENEKVAYGVGNDMICCMDCFSQLEPMKEDYEEWMNDNLAEILESA